MPANGNAATVPLELKLVSFERGSDEPLCDIDRVLKSLGTLGPHLRKFIVLVGSGKLYMVVGMKFFDERKHQDFYMHRSLVEPAKRLLDKDNTGLYELSGGGMLEFSKGFTRSEPWQAIIFDSSSDFGVWDCRVLAHRQAIADALKMSVFFNWQKLVHPSK